jgi:hypothetical protein
MVTMLYWLQFFSLAVYIAMLFWLLKGAFSQPRPFSRRETTLVLSKANRAEYQVRQAIRRLREGEGLNLCLPEGQKPDPELCAIALRLQRLHPQIRLTLPKAMWS